MGDSTLRFRKKGILGLATPLQLCEVDGCLKKKAYDGPDTHVRWLLRECFWAVRSALSWFEEGWTEKVGNLLDMRLPKSLALAVRGSRNHLMACQTNQSRGVITRHLPG